MKLVKGMVLMFIVCSMMPGYAASSKKQNVKKVDKKAVKQQVPAVKKQPVKKQPVKKQPVKKQSVARPVVVQEPVVVQPVGAAKLSMNDYLTNKVSTLQRNLINEIFPRKDTIEQIVLDFKDAYPGPDKENDTRLIYQTIISNPEVNKMITLDNAVHVYNFIRNSINDIWTKQDEAIWTR